MLFQAAYIRTKSAIIRTIFFHFRGSQTSRVTKTRIHHAKPTSLGHLLRRPGLHHLPDSGDSNLRARKRPSHHFPIRATPRRRAGTRPLDRAGFRRQTNRTRLEPDAADYAQRPDGRHRRHRNRFRRPAQYLRRRTQRPVSTLRRHLRQRTGHQAHHRWRVRNRLLRLSRLPRRIRQIHECYPQSGDGLRLPNPYPADVPDQSANLGAGGRNGRAGLHPRTDPYLLQRHRWRLPRMPKLRVARARAGGIFGK
ncbi:hypothetical protein MCC93_08610 [Morococcus cerebrosus]|uniref:Uncharacterized protein n=1 Tax=Morococcus cerebrosus TaxID=1056807 RepID=A0A0C1ECH9_9NEIS|nr:hypothetical protein MCC93_08610 [Morococcus cerebrosus]